MNQEKQKAAPLFLGTATAIITPFTDDGVDHQALEALVRWQIKQGVSAIVACGTTGEPSVLSEDEWAETVSTVVAACDKQVPVIAGTGGNDTGQVLRYARLAKGLGAKAQLCVTPYYNKTSPRGLLAHYDAITQDGSLPVIVYNVPGRTGMDMSPEDLHAIAALPGIIAIKEASANLVKAADMMRLCAERIDFYTGSDEVIVPFMALGGAGVISVVSNVAPALTVQMTQAMVDGSFRDAARLQLLLMPLIHALFMEVSPIPAKAALSMMNRCQNILRLPLVSMSQDKQAVLLTEMERLQLL